jgi:hypothetical protein
VIRGTRHGHRMPHQNEACGMGFSWWWKTRGISRIRFFEGQRGHLRFLRALPADDPVGRSAANRISTRAPEGSVPMLGPVSPGASSIRSGLSPEHVRSHWRSSCLQNQRSQRTEMMSLLCTLIIRRNGQNFYECHECFLWVENERGSRPLGEATKAGSIPVGTARPVLSPRKSSMGLGALPVVSVRAGESFITVR